MTEQSNAIEQRQHVPSADERRTRERERERDRDTERERNHEHNEHTQLSPSAVGARLAGSRLGAPAAQQEA